MPLTDYLLFIAIAAVQVGSPGPSTLCLLNNALALGPLRALAVLSGDLLAIALLASASLLGLDALLAAHPGLLRTIQLAGAGYLAWLGARQLLSAGRHRATPRTSSHRRLWLQAFAVGISNPKAMVFFAALLPRFLAHSPGALPALGLVALFVAVKLAVSAAYAFSARGLADYLARPAAGRWGKRLTGVALLGFAGLLAWGA